MDCDLVVFTRTGNGQVVNKSDSQIYESKAFRIRSSICSIKPGNNYSLFSYIPIRQLTTRQPPTIISKEKVNHLQKKERKIMSAITRRYSD